MGLREPVVVDEKGGDFVWYDVKGLLNEAPSLVSQTSDCERLNVRQKAMSNLLIILCR